MKTIDAYVYTMDITKYCTAAGVRTVTAVYLVDRNRHVHLCELTPSVELIFLYNDIEFEDGVPDAGREDVFEKLAYDGEDTYVHARDLDLSLAAGVARPIGQFEYDEDEYGEGYEDVIERIADHERGNPTFC